MEISDLKLSFSDFSRFGWSCKLQKTIQEFISAALPVSVWTLVPQDSTSTVTGTSDHFTAFYALILHDRSA